MGRSTYLRGSLIAIGFWVALTYEFKVIHNSYTEPGQLGSPLDRCEFLALRLGSELADVFNAPGYDKDWNDHLYQDFIVENLGFTPWMAGGIDGKTTSQKDAHKVHSAGGWVDSSLESSPYEVLDHKWVYMFGDSTTRQVWASFTAPFKGNHFVRNAKEWTRHYCNKQQHRAPHPKGGMFEDEGWGGPCGLNEVTCHISGYGDGGIISYDWKHFPFEDYDEWLWGDSGPWIAGFPGEGVRRPDLLTIQFGMHSCWHASPQGLHSQHLKEFNSTMFANHEKDVWKLMAAVRAAIDKQPSDGQTRNHTTVIIVTSGAVGMEERGDRIDGCISRMNRITAEAARAYGFAVLERGEIERRLVFKSHLSHFKNIPLDMHLVQPAQNIIATSLLHLYSCLEASKLSRSLGPGGAQPSYPIILNRGSNPSVGSSPLHTPPS